MCGIVGMTFREEGWQPSYDIRKVRNIFTEMLLNAQERGSSAAGVVMTSWSKSNRKPNVVVLKAPLAAEEFVETEAYKSLMARLSKDTLSIIGHTRASTSGSATDNHNNHPHVCGSIIGVHNGHINSDEKIWLRYGETLSRKSSCDSEAMFSLLNHRLSTEDGDMSKAFQATVPELEGWYALAMINLKEPGKTYLFRDKKSPLELSWWVRNETVLFASTSTWFERALRKHEKKDTIKGLKIKPMRLLSIDSLSEQTSLLKETKINNSSAGWPLSERLRKTFNTTQGGDRDKTRKSGA